MKKLVATLLTILIILNIYIPSTFATDTSSSSPEPSMSEEGFNAGMENGTGYIPTKEGDTSGKQEKPLDDARGEEPSDDEEDDTSSVDDTETGENGKQNLSNDSSAIITALLEVLTIVPKIGSWIMSKIVLGDTSEEDAVYTIQDMLFGKYYLFDINFFSTEPNEGQADDPNLELVNNLKENVAIWYYAIRNVAIVGSALIIIYVAIRLALAISKGDSAERARYNKMIMSWLIGFILIFVVQYIVMLLFYISSIVVNFINKLAPPGSTEAEMEKSIIADSWNNIASQRGINKLFYVVLFWAVVYYQLKFFLMYAKRSLETFFLMILSPLVCMLYSIDFLGDGRSQSFQVWLKTILGYILLQPIHLGIYTVFMFTASELVNVAPLVGVVFFGALSNGEKIVKTLFGLEGPSLRGTKLTRIRRH